MYERPAKFRDDLRIAVKRSVPDDAARPVVEIQDGRKTEIDSMRA
jgi:hypothetical protein